MIYAYGVTQQGIYHVKNDTVCQDAHRYLLCTRNSAIGAVADGLGSELYSDTASRIAADVAVEYCAEHIADAQTQQELFDILCDSFRTAQHQIEETAFENGHDPDQYDTTLSLAILIDGWLYYGQSGDSGIIAYTEDGCYEQVTEQQRDEEGRVYPLYFGEAKWVFGIYPKRVASVLLATDGMLELMYPIYIRDAQVKIHVALAKYFMDSESLHLESLGSDEVGERIGRFMLGIPESRVNDDKTILVLTDDEIAVTKQPPDYYAEPDWNELKRKYDAAWRELAYPGLSSRREEEPSEEEDTEEACGNPPVRDGAIEETQSDDDAEAD
ncbi:MAG: protein phosphatase 2C domain-containing protein [Anaerofustis sp.]